MRRRAADRSRTERLVAGGVLGAAAAVLLHRLAWVEPRRLVVRRLELALPRWPAGLDGLRLALVSDLHAGGPQVQPEHVARVVERTLREKPDLIAVLGDVIDVKVHGGAYVSPDAIGRELAKLRAPLGVFAVMGNHDWHSGEGLGVLRALREAGLTVLENAASPVVSGDTTLQVAGVADAHTRLADVYATLRDVPAGDPVLLLSHNPDVFPQVPPRVALTVSGHTHGGQVDIPLVRRLMIPSRFGDRYAHGHKVEGGRHLYVTSGVGTSRWPIRLRRPPEIVVLTLRAA